MSRLRVLIGSLCQSTQKIYKIIGNYSIILCYKHKFYGDYPSPKITLRVLNNFYYWIISKLTDLCLKNGGML